MNRAEASAAGILRYDSPEPCKHGHRPQRYTKTGICVQCAAANTAKNRGKYVVRAIAGMMGLVDLAGVRVRPGDVETVMAVIDACNLMSGAPVANRPVTTPTGTPEAVKHYGPAARPAPDWEAALAGPLPRSAP